MFIQVLMDNPEPLFIKLAQLGEIDVYLMYRFTFSFSFSLKLFVMGPIGCPIAVFLVLTHFTSHSFTGFVLLKTLNQLIIITPF